MRLTVLDLVRFFAALSVVLYHYTARSESNLPEILSEVTKFGYLGVSLFFIISGYVIALSASNRSAFEFAISRLVRLYPAFWSCVVFTVLVTSFYEQNNYTLAQVLANLTMLNDYLGIEDIDGVYWTLQAELKFYACVFCLILLGVFDKFRLWLSVWLALTVLYLITNQPFFMGWFISPSYSSFFIAGVAFYLVHKEGKNIFNLLILFSSLVISSFRGFEQASMFMKSPSVVDAIIAVILIWFFYLLFSLMVTEKVHLPKRKIYLTIGGLTYPLYLIHSKAGKTILDNSLGFQSEGMAVTITISLMLLFSYLIHIGIEKKIASHLKPWLLNMVSIKSKVT